MIQDIGVHQTMVNQSSTSSSGGSSSSNKLLKTCFHCRKKVELEKMRCHVGSHILHNEIGTSRTCGFCGKESCDVKMKTSKKQGKPFYTLEDTDCPYFYDYGRVKVFKKKSNPCTNRVVGCCIKECKSMVWTYNMGKHYIEKHDGDDVPTDLFTAAEREYVSSL